jgi:threonine aldolase
MVDLQGRGVGGKAPPLDPAIMMEYGAQCNPGRRRRSPRGGPPVPDFEEPAAMPEVDLRSDTVTQPTPAMRRAMAAAEVGDDVLREDPTVRRLEELAAERLGKPAALFVPSGTMANLASLLTHCPRGAEVILGDQAHIFYYEQGGAAALGGIHPRTLPNRPDGTLDLGEIEAAVRPDDVHFPRTCLIALENTHNRCSGAPLPPDYLRRVGALKARLGLRLHVDGARIFNAAAALEVSPAELAAPADSVTCCLSKGLGAPAGSLICGPADFIAEARRVRKVLGGGMRQAGILAAAGIVALTEMPPRLAEDHAHAARLARGLEGLPGLTVVPAPVRTNIVYLDLDPAGPTAAEVAAAAAARGVKLLALGPRRLRAVTHHHIREADIDQAMAVLSDLARTLGRPAART